MDIKDQIINSLKTLPTEILAAEKVIIESMDGVQEAKEILTAEQDRLLVAGTIDGKNAEIRAAQLRELTVHETGLVKKAEGKLNNAKAKYNFLLNTQANYRAIAGLLKAGE